MESIDRESKKSRFDSESRFDSAGRLLLEADCVLVGVFYRISRIHGWEQYCYLLITTTITINYYYYYYYYIESCT